MKVKQIATGGERKFIQKRLKNKCAAIDARCAERPSANPKRNGLRHPKLICGCVSGWKLVLIDAGIKRCSLAIAECHKVLAPRYDTAFCIKARL